MLGGGPPLVLIPASVAILAQAPPPCVGWGRKVPDCVPSGNKFEFRAVGSSQNVAVPVAALNCALSCALQDMNAEMEAKVRQIHSVFLYR